MNKNETTTPILPRRDLLGAAAGLSVLALPGGLQAAQPQTASPRFVPGIQLYTVRASMAQDVTATLTAIAAIGYREVEFAGYFDTPPSEMRALLEGLGLSAPSCHLDARAMRDQPLPLLEAAAAMGHYWAIIAWLHPEDRQSIDDYKGWAEVLNRVGALCREHGLRIAYHNHDFEFAPIGGVLPYEVLLAETDPALVDFELDFFWAVTAGHDVVSVLQRAPQRFALAHIKDMGPGGEMVDVGSGQIDFTGILANAVASGLKHLYVEHDEPADPFRSAAISRLGLSRIIESL